jgi:hypothetical protein
MHVNVVLITRAMRTPVQTMTKIQRRHAKCGNGRKQPAAGTPNADPLLSERELAARFGWSPKTLQRRRWAGLPPEFVKVGRSVRYRLSAAESFIRTGNRDAPCRPEAA